MRVASGDPKRCALRECSNASESGVTRPDPGYRGGRVGLQIVPISSFDTAREFSALAGRNVACAGMRGAAPSSVADDGESLSPRAGGSIADTTGSVFVELRETDGTALVASLAGLEEGAVPGSVVRLLRLDKPPNKPCTSRTSSPDDTDDTRELGDSVSRESFAWLGEDCGRCGFAAGDPMANVGVCLGVEAADEATDLLTRATLVGREGGVGLGNCWRGRGVSSDI
jgi:hypothetical protein